MQRALIVSTDRWGSGIEAVLGTQGFLLSHATDFEIARNIAAAITIDCIIYDWDQGVLALEKLRLLQPRALVFLVTSSMTIDPEEVGADYLLLKPVDHRILEHALKEISWRRSRSF